MDGQPLIALAAVVLTLLPKAYAGEFQKPVKITVAGKPIDVQRSAHSAPFVGDFDGDGVNDLLVGEYHGGRLRVFRNVGTNANPKFRGFEWFKASGDFGRVPSG